MHTASKINGLIGREKTRHKPFVVLWKLFPCVYAEKNSVLLLLVQVGLEKAGEMMQPLGPCMEPARAVQEQIPRGSQRKPVNSSSSSPKQTLSGGLELEQSSLVVL